MQSTIRDESSRAHGAQISAINNALANKVGPQNYRIRFKNPTTLTFGDGLLKTRASNLFIASRTKDHFSNEICLAVRVVTARFSRKFGTARLDL